MESDGMENGCEIRFDDLRTVDGSTILRTNNSLVASYLFGFYSVIMVYSLYLTSLQSTIVNHELFTSWLVPSVISVSECRLRLPPVSRIYVT
jgi:hypothetical protein